MASFFVLNNTELGEIITTFRAEPGPSALSSVSDPISAVDHLISSILRDIKLFTDDYYRGHKPLIGFVNDDYFLFEIILMKMALYLSNISGLEDEELYLTVNIKLWQAFEGHGASRDNLNIFLHLLKSRTDEYSSYLAASKRSSPKKISRTLLSYAELVLNDTSLHDELSVSGMENFIRAEIEKVDDFMRILREYASGLEISISFLKMS